MSSVRLCGAERSGGGFGAQRIGCADCAFTEVLGASG